MSAHNPRSFGKSLSGDLAEFWRYRVGDYRILIKIEEPCSLTIDLPFLTASLPQE